MNDLEFGESVREARKARPGKPTQAAVAAALERYGVEIGPSWISRVEHGERPSMDLRRALEDYLGLPASDPPDTEPAADLASAIRSQADAIDRQADAIDKLADRIEKAGLSVMAGVEGQGHLLARLVSAQAREGSRGRRAPDPPTTPETE